MYKQRKVSTYGHRPWLEDSQAIIYLNVKESPKYVIRLYTAWNYQNYLPEVGFEPTTFGLVDRSYLVF